MFTDIYALIEFGQFALFGLRKIPLREASCCRVVKVAAGCVAHVLYLLIEQQDWRRNAATAEFASFLF